MCVICQQMVSTRINDTYIKFASFIISTQRQTLQDNHTLKYFFFLRPFTFNFVQFKN